MKEYDLNLFARNGAFEFNQKFSLADNYKAFQHWINFERGVEFLIDSLESSNPIIYMFTVPGLDLNIKNAERQLSNFNKALLLNLADTVKEETDLFKLFEKFIDLYHAVHEQQNEYRLGREKYFGHLIVSKVPEKEIRENKLPRITSHYKGTLLNIKPPFTKQHIDFDELGTDVKDHLEALYLLKRRNNMRLIKELEAYKASLFNKEQNYNRYKYKGKASDLLELAICLTEMEKVKYFKITKQLDKHIFFKDFLRFFGLGFSKLSSYHSLLISRKSKNKLFILSAEKALKKFLDSI